MEEEVMKTRASYHGLLEDISVIIANGRRAVVRRIDTIHVVVYWLIGRRIVEFYQQGKARASYGEEVLIKLSADLRDKHGKGFSVDNLENMRRFYMEFPKILNSAGTINILVSEIQGAIAFIGVDEVSKRGNIKVLRVNGKMPDEGGYPF